MAIPDSRVLGRVVQHPIDFLDFFPADPTLSTVSATCSEVSALCPVTGQPDIYTVIIEYNPVGRVIESKSLKLFLWRFRDQRIGCEDLASTVARDLHAQHSTEYTVTTIQQSRGGIVLRATAKIGDHR
ncbi:hypothetical protein [Nocardia sp. NPDC050793]|uniref:hypothetical protein n=1 Tax=Nocardia sp. NPDC050793 TaxID=3155159 RepID=UPI00340BD795